MALISDWATLGQNRRMQQVQISYRRPSGLSDDQLRSWLVGQARSPVFMTLEPAAAYNDRGVVRVTLEALRDPRRAEDVIAGLVGDMAMLGLQPAVVART